MLFIYETASVYLCYWLRLPAGIKGCFCFIIKRYVFQNNQLILLTFLKKNLIFV